MGIIHEERGVALGLAIMVVLVVGVMGAGLLVFVRNDLESVVRANQGQNALRAADSGVEAAKRRLLGDASPASYDSDGSGGACDSSLDSETPISSEWANGASRDLPDGEFVSRIRWLGAGCGFPAGGDPDDEYFEVVSTGISGDAKRKVSAVYAASATNAPLAVFASGDARIEAGAVVDGASVFSGGDVFLEDADALRGTDAIYGVWRTDGGAERPINAAGVGAVGEIFGDRSAVGTRDFDESSSPRFTGEAGEGELSFPFDPDALRDESSLEFLKEEAASQGNFRDSGGTLAWPESSTESTVVYVESEGLAESIELSSSSCDGRGACRGVLVVENGSAVLEGGAVFRGAVVAAGGDASSVVVEEGAILEGAIVSSETVAVSGGVRGIERNEAARLPGFHEMEIRSWRELYE